jgi:hypothetical protein
MSSSLNCTSGKGLTGDKIPWGHRQWTCAILAFKLCVRGHVDWGENAMFVFTQASLAWSYNGYYCVINALRQNRTYHWKQMELNVSSDTKWMCGFRAYTARQSRVYLVVGFRCIHCSRHFQYLASQCKPNRGSWLMVYVSEAFGSNLGQNSSYCDWLFMAIFSPSRQIPG